MDALYAIQLDLQKQIANAFTNFKKKGAGKMTIITAQARLNGLESWYSQFVTNHQKILTTKGVPQDHEYFMTEVCDQVTDSYYDRKGEFLQFIDDTKLLERERNPASPTATPQDRSIIVGPTSIEAHSLPKMNLPKFSGKFSEWENFRDLFRSVVHRRADLDASIKYYHLRTNLSGEAMEQIKTIPIAGDQYERAWNTLTAYYDNKRRTVNTLIGTLLAVKAMKAESQSELKRINREFFSPLESLEKLGRTRTDIGNDLLVYLTIELFDCNTRKEWKKSIDKSNDTPPTLEQLRDFIKGQIENLDDGKELQSNSPSNSHKGKVAKNKSTKNDGETNSVHSFQTTSNDSSKGTNCILCKADHYLSKCDQFSKKSIVDRREFAKERRICFNCLSSGHSKNRCRSRHNCFICKARHHTLLHIDTPESEQSTTSQEKVPPSQVSSCSNVIANDLATSTSHATQTMSNTGVLLATALVCVSGPANRRLTVRALIDPCSQVSLVTQNLCNQLALSRKDTRVCVQGVGEKNSIIATKQALIKLTPHFNSTYFLETTALVLPKLSAYQPPKAHNVSSFNYLNGLQLADPNYLENTRIELLLGADVYSDIVEGRIIRGSSSQPIATSSKLGWLLSGKCSNQQLQPHAQTINISVLHCASENSTGSSLSDLLQEFWRVEEVLDLKNSCSTHEKICEELFVSTTSRDKNGRYTVRLPWKDTEYAHKAKIGNSFRPALCALKRLELNFQRDKKLQIEYSKFMKEYLDLGHMSEVLGEEPSSDSNHFFLPHHGVWKESSTTTKLRTVFNGSSRFSSDESLNDLLHTGANLLNNPIDLVCTIRNYKIALSADVEKHFRQVGVDPQDRRFQTILWRSNPHEKIRMFILNTVTYGLTCSSFLALRTLIQMANDYEQEFPVAASIIREEMYADNVLTGAHSLDEALDKVSDLISLFKRGQMNLRKWTSNDSRALKPLPDEMLASERMTLFDAGSYTPVLGIDWHPSSDHFCFHLENIERSEPATKRHVLSRIARLFDPLGWIAPVTVVAKILMQSLWLQKIAWDEPLPKDIAEKWFRWLEELPTVSAIRIPRWTGFTLQTKVELHGFADASKVAYGAVLYLRLMLGPNVSTSLQVAKSKVAPVKTLSIPRLELCASLLLARLAKRILDSTKLQINDVHLWTDSADVLFWLRDHPSRWNTFVANRCSEIHTSLPNAFWHHVRSKDNPADLVSRGIDPSKLQSCEIWWKGPAFLVKETTAWPKSQDELNFSVSHLVTVNAHKVVRDSKKSDDIDKTLEVWTPFQNHSTLHMLLRVTAYCLRFISRCSVGLRRKENRKFTVLKLPFLQANFRVRSINLEQDELENAKLFCCLLVQRTCLREEYSLISGGKALSTKNPLLALNPIMDNGLIRVGGRLNNALGAEDARHPIILDRSTKLAELFVRQAHLRTLHGGTQLTLATLRQQVWILRGRTKVRKIIRSCTRCTRYAAQVPTQLMGDLPATRVRPASPFENSGVDYAGPISVRLTKARGKGTMKGFVCVFVCMATKAVHLELAEDYTAETFIAAFHRFTSRRGHCKNLYSDQGTNFVGADKLLKTMLRNETEFQTTVSHKLADLGTTWHFNPPSAPHFGGLWEAAVKSLKHHLRRVIGDQVLTFSELSTLLCRIEACLNSRPLTALSDDPSDLKCLTPAHFLIQRESFLLPEPDLTTVTIPIGKRWQLLSQTLQQFWARWQQEYLTALQNRGKWRKPKPSPNIGDLVLVRNELSAPSKWPLGRITALHPDDKGVVRVATVKTATTSLLRPLVKLILLSVCD